METIKLNDGTSIPSLGIGTFMLSPDEAELSVSAALKDGYRLIDTANAYQNERAVGRAMAKSGLSREEIYLSTKLWPSVYGNAKKAIDETLSRLQTPYVDMLFLHQPIGDYLGAYHAMEEGAKEGKIKSLGLSNFGEKELKEILDSCSIKPAMVQVEAHPYYPQHELKSFLAKEKIALMAWYPLGHGDDRMLKEPVFLALGKKYGKTPAQIILRWHIQEGNVVIPGSKNPEHILANADIFDFALSGEEMAAIAKLDSGKRYYVPNKMKLLSFLAYRPDFNAQK